MWLIRPALNSGFHSMKRLGVFLPPLPNGMLVYRKVTPSIKFASTHLIHLGEERQYESKVSCLRTQHKVPGWGSNLDHLIRSEAHQL